MAEIIEPMAVCSDGILRDVQGMLKSISAINIESFEEYRINCVGIEIVVEASSHFEAGF